MTIYVKEIRAWLKSKKQIWINKIRFEISCKYTINKNKPNYSKGIKITGQWYIIALKIYHKWYVKSYTINI